MCSPRAAPALSDYGLIRQFDPVAVAFLNQLNAAAPFEIVVTSTWRRHDDFPVLLQAVGVHPQCSHPNWRTGDLWHGGRESKDARPAEIEAWLVENPIRVRRDHRSLSSEALAEKVGIAPAFLSQIETGKRDGGIEP